MRAAPRESVMQSFTMNPLAGLLLFAAGVVVASLFFLAMMMVYHRFHSSDEQPFQESMRPRAFEQPALLRKRLAPHERALGKPSRWVGFRRS